MDNDTGGTGQTWQRRSTVSLMGGFGEVRLGRDYTPTFWNHTVFDPFGTNGLGSQTNLMLAQGQTTVLNGGATTTVRANNSIGYFLPGGIGGVYGQVMLAAAEGAPNGNKYVGGRIGYAAGPVNVAAAYGKTEIAVGRDQVALNVAGSVKFGGFTVMGQWHKYSTDTTTTINRDQTNIMVGGTYAFGANTLKATYGKASSDGTDRDATQFAFGYQYDLSKRTSLYATFSSLDNGGTAASGARFSVGQGATLQSGGQTSSGYNVGVRHSF
jgi:predicted porin